MADAIPNCALQVVDWGTVDYAEALDRQRAMFDKLVGAKNAADGGAGERGMAGWLVMCEHTHVYTLGRSGRAENLLADEEALAAKGVKVHRTERGGDITYHGPGQIVGYPVVDLERLGIGLRQYVEALEQAVIETVAEWGIEAGRVDGKTGVWTGSAGREQKICAVGVRASRGVVMHGLALNVATDLSWFELINPCGFVGGAVTSMEKETGRAVEMDEVKAGLRNALFKNLGI